MVMVMTVLDWVMGTGKHILNLLFLIQMIGNIHNSCQNSLLKFFRDYGYGLYGYPLVGGYHFGPIISKYDLLFAGLKNVYKA